MDKHANVKAFEYAILHMDWYTHGYKHTGISVHKHIECSHMEPSHLDSHLGFI